jgi:hypothetical protein
MKAMMTNVRVQSLGMCHRLVDIGEILIIPVRKEGLSYAEKRQSLPDAAIAEGPRSCTSSQPMGDHSA